MANLLKGQSASLRYYLVNLSADPVTGLTTTDIVCKYLKSGDTTPTTKTLDASNFRELGSGVYEVDFTASELDTLGSFVSWLEPVSAGTFIQATREDWIYTYIEGTPAKVVTNINLTTATVEPQYCYRGDTPTITASIKDENGDTFDLTNYDVYFCMKKNLNDTDSEAVVNALATIVDATAGQVSYTLTTTDTATAGSYICEFECRGKTGTSAEGKVFTAVQFTLIIKPDVRRG